jgi:hypothetical protein
MEMRSESASPLWIRAWFWFICLAVVILIVAAALSQG